MSNPVGTYREIPINQIIPNPKNARTVFNKEKLHELAASIKGTGLQQLPVVSEIPDQALDGGASLRPTQLQKLRNREARKKLHSLRHKADDLGELFDRLISHFTPHQRDATAVPTIQSAQNANEGGLASAIRTHDRDTISGIHRPRDVGHHGAVVKTEAEGLN
jgi:hypothetical protein